jgi:uncharacterized protein YxjI
MDDTRGGSLDGIVGENRRLLVHQVKEWGEILLGFECRNRYEIRTEDGGVVALAAEEAGGVGRMLARNLFGSMRACRVHIYDAEGREVATGVKPFRFYFHRMEVFEHGRKVGAIQRRFSFFHRLFSLEDEDGRELLRILSPFFRIWTFKLLLDGHEVGRIGKRWGGVVKEMFSDADVFGVEFKHEKLPMEVKKLLLVATFLVDFVCFENNKGSGGAGAIDAFLGP